MLLKQFGDLCKHRAQHEQMLETEKKRQDFIAAIQFDVDLLERHLIHVKLWFDDLAHVSKNPKIART